MSNFLDDWRHYLAVSTTWLARGHILISLFNPLTSLSACLVALVYFYFHYEYLFNTSLVNNTPPLQDAHLPSHSEWMKTGGITPSDRAISDDESCIICYEPLDQPMVINTCGHIFCKDCIDKWHLQGRRSCPQCTVNLWRPTRPNERTQIETLELEPLVKFTAAATLVFAPLNLLTLYACHTYYILDITAPTSMSNGFLLTAFTLLSALLLTLATQGLQWMMQRRREQGVRWWGADIDADEDQPFRMAFTAFSLLTAWWIAVLCSILEAHTRGACGNISAYFMLHSLSREVIKWLAI